MAPVIIEFRKTLRQRLNEYRDIFSIRDENDEMSFLVRDVKNLWRDYLGNALAPRGWGAIWKVPAEKCLVMSVTYPCEILVEVLSIELETFSAVVEVIDDDEPLYATKRLAALIELYPIDHGNGFIDGWILADDLDKFRFFFVHMWYPWDETDGSESWTELVLKRRLDLLYDMVTGELSEEDSTWIRNLIAKARWNQVEIDKAADAIDEGEDSAISNRCNGSFDSRESNVSEEEEVLPYQIERMDNPDGEGETKSTENEESHVARLYELQKEMKFIQEEVELLASSSVRYSV